MSTMRISATKLKWICIIVLLCLRLAYECPVVHATTYVVAKVGGSIVVGADCRSTLTIDYVKHRPGPDVCKIHMCAPDMYFVVAANPLIDIRTGTNFSQIAEESCSAIGSPIERADRFETRAMKAADTIFEREKESSVVSVLFFGNSPSGSFFYARSIRRTPQEHFKQPVNCGKGCDSWTAGGYHNVIDSTLSDKTFFQTFGLVGGVRELLSKQINSDKTGEVGFPISILELDGSQEQWIERGACKP
jgi:hypothetical protein